MDRAFASEAKGRLFESARAHHFYRCSPSKNRCGSKAACGRRVGCFILEWVLFTGFPSLNPIEASTATAESIENQLSSLRKARPPAITHIDRQGNPFFVLRHHARRSANSRILKVGAGRKAATAQSKVICEWSSANGDTSWSPGNLAQCENVDYQTADIGFVTVFAANNNAVTPSCATPGLHRAPASFGPWRPAIASPALTPTFCRAEI